MKLVEEKTRASLVTGINIHARVWGTCGGQRTRANQEHPQTYRMLFKKVTYDHRSMNHTSICIVKTLKSVVSIHLSVCKTYIIFKMGRIIKNVL